ncbi:MAG TPA: efflux RND transporter permease subunit [Gammaproteobacteria bacterium]|nr:efflux RND transporter permease subunit [Gammaproteobacteria bacterium]
MKIVDVAIKRRVTVFMITLAIMIFGFVSYGRLRVNLLPELSYPTITVRTELEGAAPLEIENLVTRPIEESVGTIKGLRSVRSISRTGISDVTLEFAWGTNMDYAGVDIREKLDTLTLPLDAERPMLLRFDPSTEPILRFALNVRPDAMTDLSETERLTWLRRYVDEQLLKNLESIEGVAAVKASGGLEDEIQVLVDQQKLAQLRLTVAEIAARLRAENVNLSGGRLEEDGQQFLVRTVNEFGSVEEFANAIVARRNGTPVYLRDIAIVRQGHREREAITRVDGKESVEIAIYKEGDANTVAVARNVESRLRLITPDLPEEISLERLYDQSVFISQAIDEVVNSAILGGLLAMLVVYFFLRNFWTTLIISIAIPISVVGTFVAMYLMDISLNIMSLGGISLAVGMLVDSAIVTLENITRHRQQLGKDVITAAHEGTSEIGTALMASTLTTVAVFFPLVFVEGIGGQLFADQAWTITVALLFSLLLALSLVPMLASLAARAPLAANYAYEEEEDPRPQGLFRRIGWYLRRALKGFFTAITFVISWLLIRASRLVSWVGRKVFTLPVGLFQRGFAAIERVYPRLLDWSLAHRGTVLTLALAVFLATLSLVPRLGFELVPQLSQGELFVDLRAMPGAALEQTDALVREIGEHASGIDGVLKTYSVTGVGNRLDANPSESGENTGRINIVMQPGSTRADEERVMNVLREVLAAKPGVQFEFGRPELFALDTPLEVELSGYELDALKQASQAVANALEGSGRFTDVKNTVEDGYPEIQVRFDQERAAQLGLVVADIADAVVDKIRGEVATQYSWRDRKIDVLIRAREEQRASLEDVRQLVVNPTSDRPVTLESVADVSIGIGPSEIRRRNQERVAVVSANLAWGDLASAVTEIESQLASLTLPSSVTVRVTGQSEDMQQSFESMMFALALAVFLVYLVMASQFESLIHPFVIMFSIPLALSGAVLALWITGSTVSIVVFIGLMMLAGIVVNNAIVLIDMINQLRARGMVRAAAIMEAGRSRLRPIVMTMLTTVLGLLPMALGLGEGGEIRAPMAITVIGGLMLSTLLTLVVIPVMYTLMDRREAVATQLAAEH